MKFKFVKFIVFTIIVGLVSPVFGQLDIINNDLSCRPKFLNDPLYSPLHTVIKSLYKAIGSVLGEAESLSILSKNECAMLSLMEKIIDGLSTGFEILEDKNCARVSEIDIAEEATVSAAETLIETIRVAVQLIGQQQPEKFAKNIDDIGDITKSFQKFFNAVKIVLAKICTQSKNNVNELINAAHEEAAIQADVSFYNLFNIIKKLKKSTSVLQLLNGQSNRSDIIIKTEGDKAREAVAKLFENSFKLLKKFIAKSDKEKV